MPSNVWKLLDVFQECIYQFCHIQKIPCPYAPRLLYVNWEILSEDFLKIHFKISFTVNWTNNADLPSIFLLQSPIIVIFSSLELQVLIPLSQVFEYKILQEHWDLDIFYYY